jgi:hypothetical protein
MKRARLLAVSVVGVMVLAACGGGGGGGGGKTKTSVAGTAAQGAAIAGATLTLVDTAGVTSTATTAADGTFTIDTTGLTPPFMIKLVSGGAELFSVSAEAGADTVMNVTPLTDLILRSWYGVQDVSVGAAFAAPTANPAPSPTTVAVIASVVQRIVQLWLDQAGVSGDFSLISTPFDADGTGVDHVLDLTSVDTSTGGIVITDGDTTQTTAFLASEGSIEVNTVTDGADGSSSSTTTTAVPVAPTQLTALDAIAALVDQFATTVNTKGSSLAGSDLSAYMDAALRADGFDRTGYAAFLAGRLAGTTVAFTLLNIRSLEEIAGTAELSYQLSMTQGGQTGIQPLDLSFRKVGSSWLLSGNGRIAAVELRTGMVTNQGAITGGGGSTVEVDVAAPRDSNNHPTVTGATVKGGPWSTDTALSPAGSKDGRDGFELWDPTSVAAGTPFTVTVTPASGTPRTYTLLSNAVTTESIGFTGITVTTPSAFVLDTPHTMTWTLPKTFPVAFVRLGRVAYDGDPGLPGTHSAEISLTLPASAVTRAITIPSTFTDGGTEYSTVQAEVYVQAWGASGEFTTAYYQLIEPS